MDFSWSEDQLELKHSIIEFAQSELDEDPGAGQTSGFPRESWNKCASFGIHGLSIPTEYGGTDRDPLTVALALEGLGYGCRDNGLLFAICAQMWSVQQPILRFGSEAQKEAWLPALVGGEKIGAHGMTESGSGSDTFALQTTATLKGDRYILDGSKTFISNATEADVFLVFATVNKARGFMGLTALLVERDTPGLSVGAPMEKMGLESAPLAEIGFTGCEIPVSQRLGGEGNGGMIFSHSMSWERSFILATCVGTMERQVETCVDYAKTRKQYGEPIGNFQSVSNRIVDMKLRLETARLLLYRLGWLHSTGSKMTSEAAMAKMYLSECFVQSSLDAIQIHGAYGYMKEAQIERDLRDSIASRIYSGTTEVQRNIIARSLGLGI